MMASARLTATAFGWFMLTANAGCKPSHATQASVIPARAIESSLPNRVSSADASVVSDAEVTTDLDSGDTLDASRGGVSDSAPMPVATPPDSGVVRVNDGLGAVREMDRALSGGHAVRFVWRGAFDPPFFVRIDWKPDGCWLTAKRVTFSSNDNSETITSLDVSKHRHLTAAECERAAGAEAALRSAPPDDGKPGLDGATWTVDGVQGTRRFRSARWSPEDGGFRKACMVLFDLAGPRLMDQAPY